MKSLTLKVLCASLMLTVLAGCGKGKDGGSGSGSGNYNPITGGNSVGETGYNNLVAWMNQTETTTMSAFYVREQSTINGFFVESPLCQQVGINLPGCKKPTSCIISTGTYAQEGATQFSGSEGLRPQSCSPYVGAYYTRSTDTNLRDAILGKSGRVVLKNATRQSGSIYTVYYVANEGAQTIIGAAQFNITLPGRLNPVILEEGNTRIKTRYSIY